MRSNVKSFATALLTAAALAAAAAPVTAPASPVAHTSCSSGFRSATIGGSHKCLHGGEYCARRYERQYERYGYECSTSYSPPRLRRT
ncbi:MAG TPA: hypothetical protein VLJ80_13505 [Solirubrobacteraceae bacterium]|nr:hypothetical protein [Solirubrobacteraceae bacterium]